MNKMNRKSHQELREQLIAERLKNKYEALLNIGEEGCKCSAESCKKK